MNSNTLFFNPLLQGFTTNTPTSFYSRYSDDFNPTMIFPVDQKKVQSITLNLSQTYTLTPGNLTAQDGCMIIAKVVGAARLKVIGSDLNSSITGYLPTYGTEVFPGYINLSTFNATSFELLGQADGTVIEIFLGYAGGAVGFSGTFDYVFDVGWAASHTVTIKYFKVGKQVTLDFPAEAFISGTNQPYLGGTGSIPTNLLPEISSGSDLENPTVITIDSSANFSGALVLSEAGLIKIYKNVVLTGNFSNASSAGFYRFTYTYIAAS